VKTVWTRTHGWGKPMYLDCFDRQSMGLPQRVIDNVHVRQCSYCPVVFLWQIPRSFPVFLGTRNKTKGVWVVTFIQFRVVSTYSEQNICIEKSVCRSLFLLFEFASLLVTCGYLVVCLLLPYCTSLVCSPSVFTWLHFLRGF